MTAFILIVAGLVFVWYLFQRRRARHSLDHYSSADVSSSGYASTADGSYAGSGGTFGGAGASGDWNASESSGGDPGGGDGGGGGGD